jgi:hypothetical protein
LPVVHVFASSPIFPCLWARTYDFVPNYGKGKVAELLKQADRLARGIA